MQGSLVTFGNPQKGFRLYYAATALWVRVGIAENGQGDTYPAIDFAYEARINPMIQQILEEMVQRQIAPEVFIERRNVFEVLVLLRIKPVGEKLLSLLKPGPAVRTMLPDLGNIELLATGETDFQLDDDGVNKFFQYYLTKRFFNLFLADPATEKAVWGMQLRNLKFELPKHLLD